MNSLYEKTRIMKTHKFLLLLLFAGILVLTSSCFKDLHYFDKELDTTVELVPGIRGPIVYGSLSLADLVTGLDEESFVQESDSGLLFLYYTDELYSQTAREIIDIPDQEYLEVFIDAEVSIPAFLLGDVGDTTTFPPKEKRYEFVFENNERIDSINLKDGDLVLSVESTFKHEGFLKIESENIMFDGEPYSETVTISDPSGNFTYNKVLPLDGNKVTLDNTDPDTTVLPITFTLSLINSGAGVTAGEYCRITMDFVDMDFYSAFGYVGDYDLSLDEDTLDIDIFDVDYEGELYFVDPRFNLIIDNAYGIVIGADLGNLTAYNSKTGISVPIEFDPGTNPFVVQSPLIDSIGYPKQTKISIHRGNSNIDEVLNSEPTALYYSLEAETNPDYADSTYNFVTDSSGFRADFEVVLPLWLRAKNFVLEDTVDLDLEDALGDLADYLKYLMIQLKVTNGLPMEIDLQLYFADENYVVLDSLVNDPRGKFLDAAQVGAFDRVTAVTRDTVQREFIVDELENDFEKIRPTKYGMIRAEVNTAGDALQNVKFFSDYTVDFSIAMDVDVQYNSEEE